MNAVEHHLRELRETGTIPARADAFVSSPTAGNKELRESLHALGVELGRDIWVAEKSCRGLDAYNDLQVVGTLVEMVRVSDWFICLLGGPEHGDPVELGRNVARVSHFEIELYQAVMLGKPVVVFQRRGFQPGERLGALLSILRGVIPSFDEHRDMGDQAILDKVRRLVGDWKTTIRRWLPVQPNLRRRLVHHFAARRAKIAPVTNLIPEIFFLDDAFAIRGESPREELVDELLAGAYATNSQQDKLTLIWIAIRELMSEPPGDRCPPEVLKRWNDVLGAWNGAASWYGLHGHLYMGALATLGTLSRVRSAIRAKGGLGLAPVEVEEPLGAFASANYSLAKLMPDLQERARYADLALNYAQAAFARTEQPEMGLLSVRGSIHLLRGDLSAAEEDFSRAVQRLNVEQMNANAEALALADLGGLHVLQPGRSAMGRDLLHRAIRLAEEGGHPGTIARVERRLARAYLWRNPPRAFFHLAKANRLAHQTKMYDQLRWWPGYP